VIDIDEGGEFSVYYIDGQDEYSESEQNGIESSDWGTYGMSFAFEPIAIEIEWTTRARDLQGEIGDSFDVLCPEDGEASSLWGTEIYTDDSSICTAAVHMGLIDFEDGGAITMTLLEGEEEYTGSEENDIESSDWGTWSVSFSVSLTGEVIEVEWTTRARDLEGEIGDTFEVLCPEDGAASSLWGTEIYTDDSSVCTAAVHMGLIDFEDGGQITVTLLEGEKEYTGSEENDIESSNWGAWGVSFSVSESDAADTEESDQ
jgi:phage baseplate assembly protein gpV